MADLLTDAILKDLIKDIHQNFPPDRDGVKPAKSEEILEEDLDKE